MGHHAGGHVIAHVAIIHPEATFVGHHVGGNHLCRPYIDDVTGLAPCGDQCVLYRGVELTRRRALSCTENEISVASTERSRTLSCHGTPHSQRKSRDIVCMVEPLDNMCGTLGESGTSTLLRAQLNTLW